MNHPNKPDPFALIVDDDPVESRLLRAALTKLGVKSEAHANGHDFIARLANLHPTFCFVDLNIGRKGLGYTIIEAVRKTRGYDPVLIVFSGKTAPESIAHAIEVGADDFLTKPLSLKALADKVAHYVTTPELGDHDTKLQHLSRATDVRLDIDARLTRLDELGVQLACTHLLPKGVVVRLGGAIVAEATGRDDGVLVTIVSTTADVQDNYVARGEFDPTDDALLTSVRGWLTRRTPS